MTTFYLLYNESQKIELAWKVEISSMSLLIYENWCTVSLRFGFLRGK